MAVSAQKTAAKLSPEELYQAWKADPSAYRDTARIMDAGRRTVDRLHCARDLEDLEGYIAATVGPGDWLVQLTQASGGFGPMTEIRTLLDHRPEAERAPPADQYQPAAYHPAPPSAAWDPRVMMLEARLEDVRSTLDRERVSSTERVMMLEGQARQLSADLDRIRRDVTDAELRGYKRGFDEGEAHGRRVTEALWKAKGTDTDYSEIVSALGRFIPQQQQQATTQQQQATPEGRVLLLAIEQKWPPVALAEALAAAGGWDVQQLAAAEHRAALAAGLANDPPVQAALATSEDARAYVAAFHAAVEQWAAATGDENATAPSGEASPPTADEQAAA